MQIKLSERLAAVAGFVPTGSVVADIGTDHGYLPAHLIMEGISPYVIAADVHEPPLTKASQLVSLLSIDKKVSLRLGDGLQVLTPGEAQVIVIAGIGALTMIHILSASPAVLGQTQRLVLQPMRDVVKLREWLVENNWRIVDEELVYEGDLFYEIIAAEPGRSTLTLEEMEFGPVLLKKKHLLLKAYLGEKLRILKDIYQALDDAAHPKGQVQKEEMKEKIAGMERVRASL
ncbi:class I SAM-dependent methyltransferase [Dehalobacterium formicoaceticum]|uniref:Class I SAM-dependent methyltransferase n=1 Tax=Dehalobacterium formicoaceticum TaxID=51515 RepID=A0ABT1XZP7_9FIRM|nr:class I SAM-dependent methyltransferase [Dehalobacterium formicoaceticum]MCR6544094.1 class I SAM-dependent methyltransferase [Dehalobacterium formicoaceticum]